MSGEEFGYWTTRLDAADDKASLARELARALLASQEFLAKNPTSEDYVVGFYRAFLGRFPNDTEIAYWSGELDSGARTAHDLIELFADSPEFT